MEKHERNGIGARRAESCAKQRNTISIRALDWLYFFARNFGGEDARASGEINLQKWLGLILDGESDLRERLALGSDERGDRGAFGDGRQNAGIGESVPLKRKRGRIIYLPVIAKCSLQRIARQRAQVRIYLSNVQALEAARFLGGEFECALSFDQNFARLALRIFETENGRACFRIVNGTFERNQELVRAGPVTCDFKSQNAVLHFTGFERRTVNGGNLKAVRNRDGELFGLALYDIQVDESRNL